MSDWKLLDEKYIIHFTYPNSPDQGLERNWLQTQFDDKCFVYYLSENMAQNRIFAQNKRVSEKCIYEK